MQQAGDLALGFAFDRQPVVPAGIRRARERIAAADRDVLAVDVHLDRQMLPGLEGRQRLAIHCAQIKGGDFRRFLLAAQDLQRAGAGDPAGPAQGQGIGPFHHGVDVHLDHAPGGGVVAVFRAPVDMGAPAHMQQAAGFKVDKNETYPFVGQDIADGVEEVVARVSFFCMLVFFSIIRKSRIVTLVGTVLTPILLLSLLLIAYFGLQGAEFSAPTPDFSGEAFTHGIFQGYQTMDLLAAFFFSSFILQHIRKKEPKLQDKKQLFTAALSASMVGMGILSFVYYLLVLLGACYADKLVSIAPEQMLGFIAENALGPYGLWLVCIAVVVACFTTAIVLTSLFADFIKSRVCMDKISSPVAISTTLLITFLVSSLEFSGIASIIAPILETVYPALIMLTLLNLLNKLQGVKVAKWPIFLALLFRAFAT